MQESFAEMTLAELPLVVFNMARGQGDYFQSTRGGGHGDYRHIVLAPMDIAEAVEHTQLAFHLADTWRNPVLVYGDYLLAHTSEAVDVSPIDLGPVPAKDWAVDGSLGGTGRSRSVSSLGIGKHGNPGPGIEAHFQAVVPKQEAIAAAERCASRPASSKAPSSSWSRSAPRPSSCATSCASCATRACRSATCEPITLWPFPYEAVAAASEGVRAVLVFELNSGQMVDDVRLGVLGPRSGAASSEGSPPTAPASAWATCSTSTSSARRIEAALSSSPEGVRT